MCVIHINVSKVGFTAVACRAHISQCRYLMLQAATRSKQDHKVKDTAEGGSIKSFTGYLSDISFCHSNFLTWPVKISFYFLLFPFHSTLQPRKIVSISVNVMTHGGWARPLELEPHPATCLSGGQTTNRGCQGLYTVFLIKLLTLF